MKIKIIIIIIIQGFEWPIVNTIKNRKKTVRNVNERPCRCFIADPAAVVFTTVLCTDKLSLNIIYLSMYWIMNLVAACCLLPYNIHIAEVYYVASLPISK